MQSEFAALCEFTEARPNTEEIIRCDVAGESGQLLGQVVHPVLAFSEAVGSVRSVNEYFNISSNAGKIRTGDCGKLTIDC